MAGKKATYEILRDTIIPAMKKAITGKYGADWVDNLDGTFTLATCSTLWAYPGMTVTIGGSDYLVYAVVNNTSITVQASADPSTTTFDLSLPYFWHGTIRFVNDETSTESDDANKFPMIFLHEPTNERHEPDEDKQEGMRSECELYFMRPSDWTNWTNEQHYEMACAPMRNMCFAFIEALENNFSVLKPMEQYFTEDRVKWGQAVINGNYADLISGELSGTSLKINPVFEKSICRCEC